MSKRYPGYRDLCFNTIFLSAARVSLNIHFDPGVFLAPALTSDTFAESVNQSVIMFWVAKRPIGGTLYCQSGCFVFLAAREFFSLSQRRRSLTFWLMRQPHQTCLCHYFADVEIFLAVKLCWAALCITVAEWFIRPDRYPIIEYSHQTRCYGGPRSPTSCSVACGEPTPDSAAIRIVFICACCFFHLLMQDMEDREKGQI